MKEGDDEVLTSEAYTDGVKCCGLSPVLDTIDTGRRWQARWEYRVRCTKCDAQTTQCTWRPDAKTLWDHGDRVT